MVSHTPHYLEIMPIPEIAFRLQGMMWQNASGANYVPFAALARHLNRHRDTIYAAANGDKVNYCTQVLLSRFLVRFEAGELVARKISKIRYEIFEVENPKPRLRLRLVFDLNNGGCRITFSPYQVPPTMPSFADLFNKR